jgi:hypothetical protein
VCSQENRQDLRVLTFKTIHKIISTHIRCDAAFFTEGISLGKQIGKTGEFVPIGLICVLVGNGSALYGLAQHLKGFLPFDGPPRL